MSATGRRMSIHDRGWHRQQVVRALGPLPGITVTALRAALISLHSRYPDDRAVSRLDRERERWIRLSAAEFAAWVPELVCEVPASEQSGTDAVLRYLLEQPVDDRPVVFAVHGDLVGIRLNHAVGDARQHEITIPVLLGAAAAGQPVRVPERPACRAPLGRALLRHFGRDPRRLVRALRVARPSPVEPPADTPLRLWQPHLAYHATRSEPDGMARIRAWRADHAADVSVASILSAAIYASFAESLDDDRQPGLTIMVDARRYLGRDPLVPGNFAAPQYLLPDDARDPHQVQAALRAAVEAGRPLTTLALRDLQVVRGGTDTGTPDAIPTRPRAHLLITNVGRQRAFEALRWSGGLADRVQVLVPPPAGPESIVLTVSELFGSLHLSAIHHRTTFDPVRVARALEAVVRDPVALLGHAEAAAARTV